MSEPTTATPGTGTEPEGNQAPAAAGPDTGTAQASPAKKSLEDSLASLDEATRSFILGEVRSARDEAKGLRGRLKDAEPKLSEYDRLIEASKTAEQRAQEAAQAAQQRATQALQRVARAEVTAALASAGVDDPAAVIEDLDMSRFLDSDGEIDTNRVDALKQKYAAFKAAQPRPPRPDASQASGANGKTPASPAQEFASFINQQIGRG